MRSPYDFSVFEKVHYKVNKDKSDMKYCLIQENGKLVTVNLQKYKWEMMECNTTF